MLIKITKGRCLEEKSLVPHFKKTYKKNKKEEQSKAESLYTNRAILRLFIIYIIFIAFRFTAQADFQASSKTEVRKDSIMPCYSPLKAYQIIGKKTEKGKQLIIFNREEAIKQPYKEIDLPCSSCIGCRIERSRSWAIRCVVEAQTYGELNNCFITLTYNDDNIPKSGSLEPKHFQNFMKELRRQHHGFKAVNKNGRISFPIRFFHCGEYGESCRNCGGSRQNCICRSYTPGLGRPHHHACIFNFRFPDMVRESKKDGHSLYTSEALSKIWKKGYHSIGDVTFKSAAYTARYIIKKITGKRAKEHYNKIGSDGKKNKVLPEYITMSRRPGIGKEWYDKYKEEIFQRDFVVGDQGQKIKIPKYFNKMFEETNPEFYEQLQKERRKFKEKHPEEYTLRRLNVKYKVKNAQVKNLKRSI